MISVRIVKAIIAQFFFVSVLYSQETHVHRAYDRATRVTWLKSDHLILLNTPDQFLELQLLAAWPGEARVGPPKRILMELISRAPEAIYLGQDYSFSAVADSTTIDFGKLSIYAEYQQIASEFPNIYNFRDSLERIPIPLAAAILAAHSGVLLTAERLHTSDVEPEQIAKLAKARQIALTTGSTMIDLTEDQLSIVRDFERSLLLADDKFVSTRPASPTESEATKTPDVPLDTTTASLSVTLGWLKEHLAANGRTIDFSGLVNQTQFEDISDCQVTLSVNSLNDEANEDVALLKPSLQYQINLADLNPESATISSVAQYYAIRFATHDSKPMIQVVTKQQVTGTTSASRRANFIGINIRNTRAAFQIRAAMVHAIKLCHSQR